VSTSARAMSRCRIALSSGDFRSAVKLSLFLLIVWNNRESPSIQRFLIDRRRHASPTTGRSILITLAPRSASLRPAEGPERYWLNSITVNPCNGNAFILHLLSCFPDTIGSFCPMPRPVSPRLADSPARHLPHGPGNADTRHTAAAYNPFPWWEAGYKKNCSSIGSPGRWSRPPCAPADRRVRRRNWPGGRVPPPFGRKQPLPRDGG